MKESSKWWGILLVSVSCVWLTTHSTREASLLGREVLENQESMLAHQDSIRAAIERIDMRLAETLEQHASLLKADQENRSVIVDSPEKLGRSKDEREATNLSDLPRGNDIEKGVADQLINIDHAAELYESVSEGVKNFKERRVNKISTLPRSYYKNIFSFMLIFKLL